MEKEQLLYEIQSITFMALWYTTWILYGKVYNDLKLYYIPVIKYKQIIWQKCKKECAALAD